MKFALTVVQIVISLILIGLILMQARGTGFGRTSGLSSGGSFSRRGLEKLIFKLTFVIAGLFIVTAVLSLLV